MVTEASSYHVSQVISGIKEERDRRLKAARDDPEFAEVVLKQERDPDARLIVKAHNIDMVPNGPHMAITLAR